MDNSGHWLPNQDLLWQCGQILIAEIAIDVAKHAVVGKFNEIRPGVYREFMKVRPDPFTALFRFFQGPLSSSNQLPMCVSA